MTRVRDSLVLAMTIFVTNASHAVTFRENGPFTIDYGEQLEIPRGFGEGEFTLELRIRPDASFPVGPVAPQDSAAQRKNWFDGDPAPYSADGWWFLGNFLIDGHNNDDFRSGTFSVQFYGGGRVRWDFGDGAFAGPGSHFAVQAVPATSAPSLLDGQWHVVAMVRRWAQSDGADLELWIDGRKVATQRSPVRTNMRKYWDNWPGFRPNERGWHWGAEKQCVAAVLDQYEDYKGELSDAWFWTIARTPGDLAKPRDEVGANTPGLCALYRFPEEFRGEVRNQISGGDAIALKINDRAWHWMNPRLTPPDIIVTLGYLWAGVMCGFRIRRAERGEAGAVFWKAATALAIGLAVFTWLDIPLFFDQLFKVTARAGGWYEYRTPIQAAAVGLVLSLAIAAFWRVSKFDRRYPRPVTMAMVAVAVLVVVAFLRVASLHFTDVLLEWGPSPLAPIGRSLEIAAICTLSVSTYSLRWDSRRNEED